MKEYINKQRDRRKGHGGTRGRDTEGEREHTLGSTNRFY